jgi:hypothetical protein
MYGIKAMRARMLSLPCASIEAMHAKPISLHMTRGTHQRRIVTPEFGLTGRHVHGVLPVVVMPMFRY